MNGSIFLIDGDSLQELTETEYHSEDVLQSLLARFPQVLAGDQINARDPRRWLLISREVGVPGSDGAADRWSIDHLFLDQDAIPTIVEVKRSSDTRLRREVVGQMLDYAANAAVYWQVDKLRGQFALRCEREGRDSNEVLAEFLADDEPDEFWLQAKTNLQAGRVRLVFVSDFIPKELQRIVEFLNGQMDPAEVVAVEVKRFGSGDVQTLVPRVLGQTAEAEAKKAAGSPGSAGSSYLDGKVLRLRPDVYESGNPRRHLTHGWLALEILRRAPGGALPFEEYRKRLFEPSPEIAELARQITGVPNAYQDLKHIRHDVRKGRVLVEDPNS